MQGRKQSSDKTSAQAVQVSTEDKSPASPPKSTGAAAFTLEAGGSGQNCIPPTQWTAYGEWLNKNCQGIEAVMERAAKSGNQVVEVQGNALLAVQAHLLANGVRAIRLTFAINDHERLFEITGVKAIQLEFDAAGWPRELNLGCDDETVILRFTGRPRPAPAYSKNSWGE